MRTSFHFTENALPERRKLTPESLETTGPRLLEHISQADEITADAPHLLGEAARLALQVLEHDVADKPQRHQAQRAFSLLLDSIDRLDKADAHKAWRPVDEWIVHAQQTLDFYVAQIKVGHAPLLQKNDWEKGLRLAQTLAFLEEENGFPSTLPETQRAGLARRYLLPLFERQAGTIDRIDLKNPHAVGQALREIGLQSPHAVPTTKKENWIPFLVAATQRRAAIADKESHENFEFARGHLRACQEVQKYPNAVDMCRAIEKQLETPAQKFLWEQAWHQARIETRAQTLQQTQLAVIRDGMSRHTGLYHRSFAEYHLSERDVHGKQPERWN